MDRLWVMILAGGSGTRFWPLSRRARPKQLLPVLGEQALLRRTVDRVLGLVPVERVLVVSGQSHGQAVRELLPDLPAENVILEPVGRNTAAACGLAAAWVKAKAGGGVLAVLPADHLIEPAEAFRQDLAAAAQAAQGTERLITLGLQPTRPETGYGYLKQGEKLGDFAGRELFGLTSFKEKPDWATAEAYLRQGGYFWNAGIFIWEAATILAWIERLMPALAAGLAELAPALATPRQEAALARLYPGLPARSVDFGVMEGASGKGMIPASFAWSDVGSWESVHELSAKDDSGNALEGPVVCVDARGCLVKAEKKSIALLGVANLVVIDAGDAILILDRSRAQDVALILDQLKAQGRTDLL